MLPTPPPRTVPQSTWSMYQYAADREAVFTANGWSFSWRAPIGGKVNGGLSLVGSTIYVESFDRNLNAVDARTGALLWKHPLSNIAMNAPLVTNGLVIVGTGDNQNTASTGSWTFERPQGDEIDAFDAKSGALVWRFPTPGEDMPTGVLVNLQGRTTVIFSNGDDHVYALDAQTGALRWRSASVGINAMSDLAYDGHAVYGIAEYTWERLFLDQTRPPSPQGVRGWTWSIDPSSGWYNWQAPYGVADGGVCIAGGLVVLQDVRLVSPTGAAAVATMKQIGWESLLDRAQWSTHLDALDARSGKLLWSYVDAPNLRSYVTSGTFSTTGTIVGDVLFDPLQISRHIAAFDLHRGTLLWKTATAAPVKMAVLYAGGRLYAGDTDGNFYVLDGASGAVLERIRFPGRFTPSPPIIAGDTLYVVNGETLYALRLSDLNRGIISPG